MMFSVSPYHRLIPQISAQEEWAYLTNETLEGEKAIVPLLKEMLESKELPSSMCAALEQQYDEELAHVRGYYGLVGSSTLQSTGFGTELKTYVRSLDCVALKLFSLQGILEGVALGALVHRLENWRDSPSTTMDLQAYEDEKKHTSLSWPLFRELIEAEGPCRVEDFRAVEKDVNAIFRQAFSGKAIAEWVKRNLPSTPHLDPHEIDHSLAIRQFRKKSALILTKTKNEFLSNYCEAKIDAIA